MTSVARAAVTEVFGSVRDAHGRAASRAVRKGEGDFVTSVDLAAERRLRRELLRAFPDHGFVGEESAAVGVDRPFVWICDPIDGTSNYANGLPTYAVAAACLHRGRPIVAAMACAPEGEVFTAAHGLGAFCGRRRLRIPRLRVDDAAIVGLQWHRGPRDLAYLPDLLATGTRIRNLGCTVAQYCAVAAGRLTANVQEQGKVWDFVAAALVVLEAGGRVTDWQGRAIFPLRSIEAERHYPTLVAGPQPHRQLLPALREHALVVPSS